MLFCTFPTRSRIMLFAIFTDFFYGLNHPIQIALFNHKTSLRGDSFWATTCAICNHWGPAG